jgi:hypothetical protein
MKGDTKAAVAADFFEAIADGMEHEPGVARGKMFGSVGLKLRGKVFAMVVKGKLVVKLPKERVDTLVSSRVGKYFDPGHGRLMKEWIAIGPEQSNWKSLVREAKEYVGQGK